MPKPIHHWMIKMVTETPSEQEIGEREERETLDRAWASNDKVQFDNVISHNNIVARQSEIALSNAVMFQQQMNNEYLRSMQQEREHADSREKMFAERADLSKTAALENNRYTLDRLYSVFPEEAVGLKILVKAVKDEPVEETE